MRTKSTVTILGGFLLQTVFIAIECEDLFSLEHKITSLDGVEARDYRGQGHVFRENGRVILRVGPPDDNRLPELQAV